MVADHPLHQRMGPVDRVAEGPRERIENLQGLRKHRPSDPAQLQSHSSRKVTQVRRPAVGNDDATNLEPFVASAHGSAGGSRSSFARS